MAMHATHVVDWDHLHLLRYVLAFHSTVANTVQHAPVLHPNRRVVHAFASSLQVVQLIVMLCVSVELSVCREAFASVESSALQSLALVREITGSRHRLLLEAAVVVAVKMKPHLLVLDPWYSV